MLFEPILSLVICAKTWPLITVPSGFTLARSWLTLSTIFPAGAGPDVKEKICVPPLMVIVLAVIVIVPGGKPEFPPCVAVLICPLYRATTLAGSADSGRSPEIVIVPRRASRVARTRPWAIKKHPSSVRDWSSIRVHVHPQGVDVEHNNPRARSAV